jgi:hypothetical protein
MAMASAIGMQSRLLAVRPDGDVLGRRIVQCARGVCCPLRLGGCVQPQNKRPKRACEKRGPHASWGSAQTACSKEVEKMGKQSESSGCCGLSSLRSARRAGAVVFFTCMYLLEVNE